MLKTLAFATILVLVGGSSYAQDDKATQKEDNSIPRTLDCFVHYSTKGNEGLFEGVNLVGGGSELRQNNFLGGFSADLSQFVQYSDQPKKLQLFSLVGNDDDRVNPIFDVSLYYWYNSKTKNLSMVGITLRLTKDGKSQDAIQKRLDRPDKSYDFSIKQEFSAHRETTSIIELPNPNRRSKVAHIRSECYLK